MQLLGVFTAVKRLLARWRGVPLAAILATSVVARPLAAQPSVPANGLRTDLSVPARGGQGAVQAALPQVPFAAGVQEEVIVFGQREPLGLPDSVRADLWRSQRRELQAMMLERERRSNKIPLEGVDALLGTAFRIRLLPLYDPITERRLEYRINDAMPVGLINLFCAAFGGNNDPVDLWREY